MEYTWSFVALIVLFHIGRYYITDYRFIQESKEADELYEKNRKSELKKIFTERENRKDYSEFDEIRFWNLVREVSIKSKGNYKNFIGLFRDEVISLKKEEIIQLDNLIDRLFFERYSYDLLYTSYIILKKGDIEAIELLMSIFVSKGEVFFKNACINTDLCLGKNITNNKEDRVLFDLTNEAYVIKTNKLIPISKKRELELKGDLIEEKEIPKKYSNLWNEYFHKEI